MTVDLDALKAEIATEVLEQIACEPFYAEFAVRDGTADRIVSGVVAIIARHVAPVVTPEPDAEARDVLAEALYFAQCDATFIPFKKREYEYQRLHADADAGLAALRERGFAVVRTADLKNANRYATNYLHDPLRVPDWLIRLREAIR